MEDLEGKVYDLVRKIFEKKEEKFVPGQTPILTGWAIYGSEEVNAVIRSHLSGWLGLSKTGKEFEERFSEKIDVAYSVFVNSGSSANLLALNAIKNQQRLEGGEIIIPACSFPTTLNPIIQLGFTPCFVDIDKTLNIDPEKVHDAINKNSRGIVFAHNLGNPAKLEEILRLADENGLFIIEDCCDALGSSYQEKPCGSFGTASTFSFYPAHIITTGGEGGIVSTKDQELQRIVRSLRDWGKDCWCRNDEKNLLGTCGRRFDFRIADIPYDHKYIYSRIGYNLKPTEAQAAFGLEQLTRFSDFVRRRKENFGLYKEKFREFGKFFELPEITEDGDPTFFGFPIIIKDPRIERKDLLKFLNENKIATRLFFGSNITYQPAYSNTKFRVSGSLEKSDNILRRAFWIGVHPGISRKMIEYVSSKFKEYIGNI